MVKAGKVKKHLVTCITSQVIIVSNSKSFLKELCYQLLIQLSRIDTEVIAEAVSSEAMCPEMVWFYLEVQCINPSLGMKEFPSSDIHSNIELLGQVSAE